MTHQKKLNRSRKDSMFNGTCGGVAEYFNIQPALLRIGLVLSCFFLPYTGIIVFGYLLCYFIIPLEPKAKTTSNHQTTTSYQKPDPQYNESELNQEFDSLDKSLTLLEKKLERLEDLAVKRNAF